MMTAFTNAKESATRKKIDAILNNLGWNTDESAPGCNVFTERCKTVEQKKLLCGNEPDYVLYEAGVDRPIAIIETKKPGEDLAKALAKANSAYAKPLGIRVVFVTDGSITGAYDAQTDRPLRIDGDTVTELLPERLVLQFTEHGPDIYTPEKVSLSKRQLIRVFAEANDLLRKEGLREGIERFTEFSNLLFLKLISEIEEDREKRGEKRILERRYCWDQFYKKPAPEMLDYINDIILPRLVDKYNHSGDVFQTKLLIKNPETLKKIVDKLSVLQLLDADSDIKGDAFEYFLKNSVTVGNDLGEYFTPRHVVKLMVDLVDPRFEETVYDPCCGTGGFLIEAFRHIKRKVKQTVATLKKLKEDTIYGRELTGTAKIAKMNMILTGDGHTNIKQMDSLEKPVKNKFGIVLTNYPFSQTTDFAAYYGLTGQDANPVFLAHVIDALDDGGRAGVVVPEGMLFDDTSQYVSVRRMLVEKCSVIAVIRLHSYVFRPYTGQPTSILIFEKGKQTKNVWFFDVREDGYEKTASKLGRPPIAEDDIRLLRQLWDGKTDSAKSFTASFEQIAAQSYKLAFHAHVLHTAHPGWMPLGGDGGLCDILMGGTPSRAEASYWSGNHPWATIRDMKGKYIEETEEAITDAGVENSSVKLLPAGTVILSFKLSIGKVGITKVPMYTNEAIVGLVPKDNRILPMYLYYILRRLDFEAYMQPAAKGMTLNKEILSQINIPAPKRSEQERVIKALDAMYAKRDTLIANANEIARVSHEFVDQHLNSV